MDVQLLENTQLVHVQMSCDPIVQEPATLRPLLNRSTGLYVQVGQRSHSEHRPLDLSWVPPLLGIIQLLPPGLQETFEGVPSVSEGPHGVHIEGVLSLTHSCGPHLLPGLFYLLVCPSTVV